MHYFNFSKEDKELIDKLTVQLEGQIPFYTVPAPHDFDDNEFFFRTQEEIEEVIAKLQADTRGLYDGMAEELTDYLEHGQHEDGDMKLHVLMWGYVARIGDGRYFFWSDFRKYSKPFFE